MQPEQCVAAADLSHTVLRITEDVLETMFYLFPEPVERVEEEDCTGPTVSAVFRFRGEPSGALLVSLSRQAALTAAANFLALEEADIFPERIDEVVCELANMIGGSLLGSIEGATPLQPFPPEMVPADRFQEVAPSVRHRMGIENGTLAVSLYWEQ